MKELWILFVNDSDFDISYRFIGIPSVGDKEKTIIKKRTQMSAPVISEAQLKDKLNTKMYLEVADNVPEPKVTIFGIGHNKDASEKRFCAYQFKDSPYVTFSSRFALEYPTSEEGWGGETCPSEDRGNVGQQIRISNKAVPFSILTYNMHFFDDTIPGIFGGVYFADDLRKDALIDYLSDASKGCVDVVCLQEVWGTTFQNEISNKLKSIYPYSATLPDKHFYKLTGGILFLSRHPIYEQDSRFYENVSDIESHSQKGFLRIGLSVQLPDKSIKKIIIGTTHASDNTTLSMKDLPGAFDFIFKQGNECVAENVIFAGDFNVHYTISDEFDKLESIANDHHASELVSEKLPALSDRYTICPSLNTVSLALSGKFCPPAEMFYTYEKLSNKECIPEYAPPSSLPNDIDQIDYVFFRAGEKPILPIKAKVFSDWVIPVVRETVILVETGLGPPIPHVEHEENTYLDISDHYPIRVDFVIMPD
jgi:hypothetical protein